jgi:uncharacterized membrane protein YhaH (DUF805 family)
VRILSLRINRRLFWVGFALTALGTALAAPSHSWVLNGGFVLPWMLLHAARLHDIGWRGLWAPVVVTAALVVLVALATTKLPTLVYGATALICFAGLLLFTLWIGLKRGDAGRNRFGDQPVGWRVT